MYISLDKRRGNCTELSRRGRIQGPVGIHLHLPRSSFRQCSEESHFCVLSCLVADHSCPAYVGPHSVCQNHLTPCSPIGFRCFGPRFSVTASFGSRIVLRLGGPGHPKDSDEPEYYLHVAGCERT